MSYFQFMLSKIRMKLAPTTKLTHQFEGYSVWLEPCENDKTTKALKQEMTTIASMCGGEKNGVYEFQPHCTMLYNFSPVEMKSSYRKLQQERDCLNDSVANEKDIALSLLTHCKEKFNQYRTTVKKDDILLKPESLYFFPYPKEADNGRGFGCVIPLIIYENKPQLHALHDIIRNIFPPDERHKESDSNDKANFVPHMAFCYAPEVYHDKLAAYTESMRLERKYIMERQKTGYLSVWSTKGGLKDWKLIARVKLDGK